MNRKTVFVILATVFSVWAFWSGALAAGFEKNVGGKSRIVLTIDKNSGDVAKIQKAFRNISNAVGELSGAVFSAAGGPVLVQNCRENPVLFGGLFICIGVSLCGVGFVIHMIRTDSWFS